MRSQRSVLGLTRAIADVLRSDWDPIGGGRMPDLPADEYDAYAEAVLDLVLAGRPDLEVAGHLVEIERDRMGLPPRAPSTLLHVVRKLHAVVDHEPLSRWLLPSPAQTRPAHADLEEFIGARLSQAGVWSTPRESDGIRDLRIILDSPARTVLAGELWTIDQVVHLFCLEMTARQADRSVDWTLFYDLARPARSSVYLLDEPRQERWRVELSGRAPREA